MPSVRLAQGNLHYRDAGSGPPIVFVHGVFVNGLLWRKVTARLQERFRCIAPDWPMGAHPEPMEPDADLSTPGLARLVADFLSAMELRDVTLVGNDTGGAVCQLVAAYHPDRVGRLVLTSCDAFEVFPPRPFGFLRLLPRIPGAAAVLARGIQWGPIRRLPIAFGWVTSPLPEARILDAYTRPLLDRAVRADALKMLRGIHEEHTLAVIPSLRSFRRPVLLAWGGDDRLFPLDLAQRLHAVFPDPRLEVIAGARTFVAEDRPEELARLISDFAR